MFTQCRHLHRGAQGLFWNCAKRAGHWFRHVDAMGRRWWSKESIYR